MDIKLIALDLDGTLLDPEKRLTDRCRRALARAADRGIWIVPATGRFYRGIPDFLRALPFIRYAIDINGAEVYDSAEDRVLYRAEIPPDLADRIFAHMDTLPVIYDCYQDGWGWMERAQYDGAGEFLGGNEELDLVQRLRTPVDGFRQVMRERNKPIQKTQMFFRLHQLDLRDAELARLPGLFPETAVSTASERNIEINSRQATKGLALEALCRHLGLDPAQAMAFGDGVNDLSMLHAAGVGVAMGNASAQVQAQADLVAPTNAQDGVAAVLEQAGIF